MSNLDNIYNQNYGKVVATNGNFVAIGNPPRKNYDVCEGISRTGQVFLLKRDTYNSNYRLVRILKKDANSTRFIIPTYYTEQSSSASLTASLTRETPSYNSTEYSCSYLIVEDGNIQTYQSTYGSSIDISKHFLAVGDNSVSSSYVTQNFSYACVDIYVINPNYTYNTSSGVTDLTSNNSTNVDTYIPSLSPLCTITGSISDGFGSSVSVTDNFLVVGAPKYNNNRGAVYIYKYSDLDCVYTLDAFLTASITDYPNQTQFGFSLSLDKNSEQNLIVGSSQISQSNAYLYYNSGSNDWKLTRVFSQNTSSIYYTLLDSDVEFVSSGSQINTRFGYSVSITDKFLAIGSPNDLVYYEYSGSGLLRQRGSVYLYGNGECSVDKTNNYTFLTKIYGDSNTFYDNLFGYSVSLNDDKLLVGSPKPYFPFSSFFISESINYYDKTLNLNDDGESTYCGQSMLYKLTGSTVVRLTSKPIGKRKELGKPFTAYGYSVSLSDVDLVVGAPIPLNDDFQLSGLFLTETGSFSEASYVLTSSYQSDECVVPSKFVNFVMEETSSCDCSLTGASVPPIIFIDEQGEYENVSNMIFGKSYVYDLADLQQNYVVGNVFYSNNKFIINNTGSVLNNITLDPTDSSKSYTYIDYQSQLSLFEKQYICTIEPGEFNTSTNPTALTSSTFDYDVMNTDVFDFDNLDIILRYINYRITTNNSEKWWINFVSGDVENSILSFYTSSYQNYESNRLTTDLKNVCSYINFDVNDDGISNIQDGTLIWKYFANCLDINNYKNYLNPRSRRQNFDNIISFLNDKTGKNIEKRSKSDFSKYNYSSSIDITGSYLAPYITTVGLYAGSDLVAIAKLAQPIKNTGEIPINIVVKWDT
jgi:hypothetical protein